MWHFFPVVSCEESDGKKITASNKEHDIHLDDGYSELGEALQKMQCDSTTISRKIQ
jgi:hypothetical protein